MKDMQLKQFIEAKQEVVKNNPVKKFPVEMSHEFHAAVLKKARQKGLTMRGAFEEAIEEWLGRD